MSDERVILYMGINSSTPHSVQKVSSVYIILCLRSTIALIPILQTLAFYITNSVFSLCIKRFLNECVADQLLLVFMTAAIKQRA